MRPWLATSLVWWVMASVATGQPRFTLTDYLHHPWQHELVTYVLDRAVVPAQAVLLGPDDRPVPVQVTPLADGRVEVAFIVEKLPADGTATYTLKAGTPVGASLVKPAEAHVLLDSGRVAARVPAPGARRFDPPAPLDQVPGPIGSVRGLSGRWLGRGRLAGSVAVKSLTTRVISDGPVYAEVQCDYVLTAGRYTARVRVVRGEEVVLVWEEFDTGREAVNHAWLELSLVEGLEPERVAAHGRFWRPRKDQKEGPAGTDYALERDTERRELSVIGYVTWWPETVRVLTLYGSKTTDTLSFFPRRIGQWRNPMGSYLEVHPGQGPRLRLPLYVDQQWNRDGIDRASPYYTGRLEKGWPATASRRLWALYLSTRERVLPAQGRSALADALIRHSDLPLDKIKDWVFEWNGPAVKYPRLYVDPEQLAAVRRRALAEPGWAQDLGRYWLRPLTYILKPDPKAGDELLHFTDQRDGSWAVWGALPGLRRYVARRFENWGYVDFPAPNNAAPMIELVRFDAAMAVPEATPAERTELKRLAAFVAQMVYDQDWHPTLAGWHLGNPNMPPRQEHHLGVASRALPTHPLAPQWRARGQAELIRLVDDMTRPSGAWRECPHYEWEAAMYPMFQSAVPLRLDGAYDLFANPKLKKTWDYLVGILMPPDPRFQAGGRRLRVLPAFGNGSWEFMPLTGWLAAMTRDTDPAFSKRMMWAWNEQGRPIYLEMSRLVIDPQLPAAAPPLQSTLYEGFGCTLRSGFPSEQETWMAFRHGDCIEHYNYGDQGSFMLCAKGAPLVLHFGSQYTPYFQGAWYFNRACVNHRVLTPADPVARQLGDDPGRYALGTELWTEDGSNDYVMHNKGFVTFPSADYARAQQVQQWQGVIGKDHTVKLPPNTALPAVDIPDHTWVRQVLFLKDPDPRQPNYYLIRDDFFSEQPLPGQWNIWTLADKVEVSSRTARVVGRYGVDLDVYMAEPADPRWSTRQETNRFLAGPSHQYLAEKPWIEVLTNLRAEQAPGRGFLGVLYPRRADEPAAAMETLADGRGVKVKTGRGTDWAFLSAQPVTWKGDGLEFAGTAGAIRQVKDAYEVIFLEPGRATVAGQTVVADRPMHRTVPAR